MTESPPHSAAYRRICSPGKTTFLKFLLTRLLVAEQVVLLYDNINAYLFYHGTVYFQLVNDGFGPLPEPNPASYRPVWALMDVDPNDRDPYISGDLDMWPIQVSPPNPVRWRNWSKQLGAALFGMPLWSPEDLVKGYAFSLFSLPSTNPGHVVRWGSSADSLSSSQIKICARVRRPPKLTESVPPAT